MHRTSDDSCPKSRSNAKQSSLSGKQFRLERLTLENFKAFDNLSIEFPSPDMANEPDIFVMGSKNGLGKTSILEACTLLFLGAVSGVEAFEYIRHPAINVNLFDLMIRAGAERSRISGNFTIGREQESITLILPRNGKISIEGASPSIRQLIPKVPGNLAGGSPSNLRFFLSLAGLNSESIFLPPLIYFHSYRKVQEGRLELGAMVDEERISVRPRYVSDRETPISIFKLEVLRSLMSRGELFENFDNKDAESILETLNTLMERYAHGRIEKLRPSADSKVEFRVTPVNNPSITFNFDGLSSGQKEIISTLFLIWHYTRTQPGIILIDEPELHLNPEWHRGFIRHLHQLSPDNQYIIATHSEDVFSAVDKNRRILLESDTEGV